MEYEILGGNLPVVVCKLTKGESLISEAGGMGWLTPDFKMSTTIKGGILKGIGRKFTKESFFMTTYTCTSSSGTIAFPSNFPGSVIAYDLKAGESIIVQKSSFLCAENGVTLSVHFKPKLLFGLFGGEGFILQKITGPGKVFLDIDGSTVRYLLEPGQTMRIDHGHIATLSPTISVDMVFVKGIMNILFSGEGLFFVELKGPGEVLLQTMPIRNVVKTIAPFLGYKSKSNRNRNNDSNQYE